MSRSLEPAAEAVPDCEPAWVSSPEVSAPGLTTPAICAASARVHLAELAVARRRRVPPPRSRASTSIPRSRWHAGPSSVRKQEGDPPPLRRAG